jgi:murein DD-endopeptidase MepM/ murein hydrolase activator NlpD
MMLAGGGAAVGGRRARRRSFSAWITGLVIAAFLLSLFAATTARADPVNPSAAEIAAAEAAKAADVAALGALAGQIAAIDGELQRMQAAVDIAVSKYNAATAAVQDAVATTALKNADVVAARATADKARDDAVLQIRANFIHGTREGGATLVTGDDPNAVLISLDVQRYVTLRKATAVTDLARLRVLASNAEAAARAAEETEKRLQAEAEVQRDAVIASLKTAQGRKADLEAQKVTLNNQAAVTFGRLQGLLDQKAAYDAWAAEQARLAAAEAARQAAVARAQNRPAPVASGAVLAPASGGTWGNPMAAGTYQVSSCFCARWGTFHYGVDFGSSLGTPMYSIGAGRVVAAGPAQGFGNWVVIDHGTGEFSVYGHMRYLNVSVGQQVVRGQQIALVGTEGDSTGPHLHLEIRLGGINGTRIDPQVWLAQRGVYI